MFGKKCKKSFKMQECTMDGWIINSEEGVMEYVKNLKLQNEKLSKNLSAIKPIINDPNFKPAISSACGECEFAVFGVKHTIYHDSVVTNDKVLLGCRRHGLCDEFKPRSSEE